MESSATGAGPTVTAAIVTRHFWLFQVNKATSHDPAVTPNWKNTGDLWSNYPAVGTASNTFTAGPYAGFLRPDQPNTVVAASMNGTMSEAYRIRSDTTYHPVIHTIYLTGNATDAVDREFLAVVANAAQIIRPYRTIRRHLRALCEPGLSDQSGNRKISGYVRQKLAHQPFRAARQRSFAAEPLIAMHALLLLALFQAAPPAGEPLRSGCSADDRTNRLGKS